MALIKTTCPYCGVGCGVDATAEAATETAVSGELDEGQRKNIIAVEGSKNHPANFGRLCVKGSALHETLSLEGRLLFPKIDGLPASWDEATDKVASRFSEIIEKHGPDSVAFYLSGQLLTEDYYVANKLMKGFVGTANVDTNSRLCMASAVVAYKRAFGSDTVPCNYEDLEKCDLLVMIGSNAAWTHPVLYQRIVAAKAERPEMRVVVVDPRKTTTCEIADLHLQIESGSDAALFSGLLKHLSGGHLNQEYIDSYTENFDAGLAAAESWDLEKTAEFCGVTKDSLETFFSWFAETEKAISFYSQGINQSSSGTDKCNAIINCHLATGRIGREGMGPFSITGQPNAMGGREVGGLANQLAAHMAFTEADIDRVGRFWNAERMATKPGLLAVDLFNAIESGDVKAVWIMGTNPVVSLPNADQVKRALDKCEFVVVSDCEEFTDTTATADVLLPALGWSEKEGSVTNSERRISIQRALNPPSGAAKDDWWILTQVARKMGWQDAFNYENARDVFVEHAKLSAFENDNTRGFNIGGLAELTHEEFLALEPIQWPVLESEKSESEPVLKGTERMFTDGHFYTPSTKAQFLPIEPQKPAEVTCDEYPLALNTGRIRDQWHTMTRTGKAERLSNHIDSPFVSIHPKDAESLNIEENQPVEISSKFGQYQAIAKLDSGLRPKNIFAPMHWTNENSNMGRIGSVISPNRDKFSGQPESKFTAVKLKPLELKTWGLLATTTRQEAPTSDFWFRNRLDNKEGVSGFKYEFATNQNTDWANWLKKKFGADKDIISYEDKRRGDYRFAVLSDDKLVALLFLSQQRENLPATAWINKSLTLDALDPIALMSGIDRSGPDKGAIICSCFEVGEKQITSAIEGGCHNVEALGKELCCGTNCGSCIPELKQLIYKTESEEQAA